MEGILPQRIDAEAVDQEARLEEVLMGMKEDMDLGMAIMGME